MAPSPFHDYLVSLVLQHMVPPGTTPLPPHLISPALASRHHLLRLTPSDAEYYCWPLTPALEPTHAPASRVVDALARLDLEVLEDTALPVRYLPSGPQALIHVPLRGLSVEQLVLVFSWQAQSESDGQWRLHDVRLFTGGNDPLDAGFATLDDALAAGSSSSPASGSSAADSDAYWNGYAASDPTSHSPGSAAAAPLSGSGSTGEDAYWARYDAERSSGHSPIPPPVPTIVTKPGALDADALANALHNTSGRPSPAPSPTPIDTANLPPLPPAPAGTAPLDLLPSPTHPLHVHQGTPQGLSLTLNLGTPPPSIPTVSAPLPTSPSIIHQSFIGRSSARTIVGSPVAGPSRLDNGAGESALAINLNPSPLSSVSSTSGPRVMPSPISPPASRTNSMPAPSGAALSRRGSHPLATSHTFSSSTSSVSSNSGSNDDVDGGLGDAVRGIYRIWRSTRNGNGGGNEEDERTAFVSFVARSLR
ncbi:hypothetical protein AURDEDRAFT_183846 [Auricularia subglabra TFB-10046 SS5]|nr:hypothetical protein AURDEDRAFT_183846 [Auricularia subglabra TFB-10046 SS5]